MNHISCIKEKKNEPLEKWKVRDEESTDNLFMPFDKMAFIFASSTMFYVVLILAVGQKKETEKLLYSSPSF